MNARLLKLAPFLAGLAALLAGCTKNNESTPAAGAPAPAAERSASAPAGAGSATKNSFQEVTSKLDKGGNFFMYLSTEQTMATVSKYINVLSNAVTEAPGAPPEKENIQRVFQVIGNLINDSGLQHVSGVGASSIAREPGFYYNKFIVHHYKGQGDGLLWKMFGDESHSLKELDLLPEETAFAAYSDLDIKLLWTTVMDELRKLKIPQLNAGLDRIPAQFKDRMGMSLDDFLGSLGGGYGILFTLDTNTTDTIDLGESKLEIPDPGLALYAKVKNDAIYTRIDQLTIGNPLVVKADEGGVKSISVALPMPLPIRLRPTVARHGDYLFLTSSDKMLHDIIDTQAGKKKGYKTTDEFKKLSQGIPTSGNNYMLVSDTFGSSVRAAMTTVFAAKASQMGPGLKPFQDAMNAQSVSYSYSVGMNTSEGWEMMANGNQSMRMMILPAVAVGGLLAAIAIPNFVRARTVAQKNVCIAHLRMIQNAKQTWAKSNGKQSGDTPTEQDLKVIMGLGPGDAFLQCPDGGTYTIGSVGEKPTCSVPGHALP